MEFIEIYHPQFIEKAVQDILDERPSIPLGQFLDKDRKSIDTFQFPNESLELYTLVSFKRTDLVKDGTLLLMHWIN